MNTVLIGGGYAKEVFSLNDMSPGDVVGWNWEGNTNYSATNLSAGATWTKMAKSPVRVGKANMMTNTMSVGAVFYRLTMP